LKIDVLLFILSSPEMLNIISYLDHLLKLDCGSLIQQSNNNDDGPGVFID